MNLRFVPPYFCVFPGYYCGTPGLTEVSAPCEPGFYCPGGQASSYEYNCTLGTYCPEGTAVPIMCETGTFQDLVGQSQCRNCTGRYYCDPYEFAVGSNDTGIIVPLSCPQGYYCPEGTGARNSYPCLPGTYGGGTELLDSRKLQISKCFFLLSSSPISNIIKVNYSLLIFLTVTVLTQLFYRNHISILLILGSS